MILMDYGGFDVKKGGLCGKRIALSVSHVECLHLCRFSFDDLA